MKQKYQVNLKSNSEPINVYLVNRQCDEKRLSENSEATASSQVQEETKTRTLLSKSNGFILMEPVPSLVDYTFNMDKSEGLFDMFDIETG